MATVLELESIHSKIRNDYQHLSVTTSELAGFLALAGYLALSPACTYRVSLFYRQDCTSTRKALRRMERMGYVHGESNGSNNIVWSLAI